MKTFFILLIVAAGISAKAQQITKVSLQASGLTCSMCSNSINKALKSINFVSNVDADIQNSSFDISFKPNANIDFDRLKKKVEDAGFSVSKFIVVINFNNVIIKNNEQINIGTKTLLFSNVKEQSLNGEKKIQILDKGFISSKQYKKNPLPIAGEKIYHVTI